MSKLSIRNGGSWVDPENIYVRQSGAWTPVEKVYYRQNGAWEEVWPLDAQAINVSFVTVTLVVDSAHWDNVIFEIQSANPDWMAGQLEKGGIGYFDTDTSTFGKILTNPREVWSPEQVYDTIRSGTGERKFGSPRTDVAFGDNGYVKRVYTKLQDEEFDPIGTSDPAFNQWIIDFSELEAEFITKGVFDWDDTRGLGNLFRFDFFAAWTENFTGNAATENIGIIIDVYEGGNYNIDSNGVATYSGFTQKLTYEQLSIRGEKLDFDYFSAVPLLPHNNSVLRFDYDWEFDNVSVQSPPTVVDQVGILPRFVWIDLVEGTLYENFVTWIDDPRVDPTFFDHKNLEYTTGNITANVYTYGRTASSTLTSENTGTGPGMDTLGETFGPDGKWYGNGSVDEYLSYPAGTYNQPFIEDNWWYTGNPRYFNSIYMVFDVWQYKWDNPDASTVSIQVNAALDDAATTPFSKTYRVRTVGDATKLDDGFESGTNINTIATVSRAITASEGTYGEGIFYITVDYDFETIEVLNI